MLSIIKIICVAFWGLSMNARAEDKMKPDGKKDISEHKKHILEDIDQRITHLQSQKTCVSAATTPEGLKECHEKSKAFHDKQREERREYKDDRRDDRREKREDRREKREERREGRRGGKGDAPPPPAN